MHIPNTPETLSINLRIFDSLTFSKMASVCQEKLVFSCWVQKLWRETEMNKAIDIAIMCTGLPQHQLSSEFGGHMKGEYQACIGSVHTTL